MNVETTSLPEWKRLKVTASSPLIGRGPQKVPSSFQSINFQKRAVNLREGS